jgi:hypothetical protein
MSRNRRATFAKRARERAKQERRQNKVTQRAERRAEKKERDPAPPGIDLDIAGIIPGPQPKEEELAEDEEEE